MPSYSNLKTIMAKIYTKTGDKGDTSIFGGKRLPKDHVRIESYGTVDELNSYIGLIRDSITHSKYRDTLKAVQNRLFTIGSNLASDPDKSLITPDVLDSDIQVLEMGIDEMNEDIF